MYDPDTGRNGYNPLENNFKDTGMTVNGITVLSRSDINFNHFEYPTGTSKSNGMIYTSDQIIGFYNSENKELILIW